MSDYFTNEYLKKNNEHIVTEQHSFEGWLEYQSEVINESIDAALIGWRAWRLFGLKDENQPIQYSIYNEFLTKEKTINVPDVNLLRKKILQSSYEETLWVPGLPAEAFINKTEIGFLANTGIHATLNKELCMKYILEYNHSAYSREQLIYGEVSIWGDVIEHERGYRAQFMYPNKLFVPNILGINVSRDLRRLYGCEVELIA